MKTFILWILKNYILEKLNKNLKKDKYAFVEKYSPIVKELNNTLNKFLDIIKDREITEQEAEQFVDGIGRSIEKLFK